jgi:hypothetical protein
MINKKKFMIFKIMILNILIIIINYIVLNQKGKTQKETYELIKTYIEIFLRKIKTPYT